MSVSAKAEDFDAEFEEWWAEYNPAGSRALFLASVAFWVNGAFFMTWTELQFWPDWSDWIVGSFFLVAFVSASIFIPCHLIRRFYLWGISARELRKKEGI